MTEEDQQPSPLTSSIVRFWERIPMAVRAITVGLFVFSIMGNVALSLIVILIPAAWSSVAIAIVLWGHLPVSCPMNTRGSQKIRDLLSPRGFEFRRFDGNTFRWVFLSSGEPPWRNHVRVLEAQALFIGLIQ